jgi:hypothetical protein
MALMIPAFTSEQIDAIATIAANSSIYRYNWDGRGEAPAGYTEGMALTWAQCFVKWKRGDSAMLLCAQRNSGNADKDALSWYRGFFDELGMSNEVSGVNTLRHLFVLLLGLGMRESSGEHCCGRDQSASNTDSDTCEAGMFQTSWNIRSCSSEIPPLLDVWQPGDQAQCYLPIFRKEVSCSSSEWACYGSGDGYHYQEVSKSCPPFHAEVTLVGLRKLRQHWGPINRYEVEIRPEADGMFKAIQDYVDQQIAPEPGPEPTPEVATITITVDPPGSARVVVVGGADEA